MAEKKPFVLRLPAEILKALEKWAADEFRSTNGQIEYLLHKALKESKRIPEKSDEKKER
jgi:hypothetical protein